MRLDELHAKLMRSGIREDFYSLSGGLPNEAFCINQIADGWEVYYSEHGVKSKRRVFSNENEACRFFYEFITSDEVVMNNLKK